MEKHSLCSDSFSGWLKEDPARDEINQDTLQASLSLYYERIPYVAKKLVSMQDGVS